MRTFFKIFELQEIKIKDLFDGCEKTAIIKTELAGTFLTKLEACNYLERAMNDKNDSIHKTDIFIIEEVFINTNVIHKDFIF